MPPLRKGHNYFGSIRCWLPDEVTIWLVYEGEQDGLMFFHYLVWGVGLKEDCISKQPVSSGSIEASLRRLVSELDAVAWRESA